MRETFAQYVRRRQRAAIRRLGGGAGAHTLVEIGLPAAAFAGDYLGDARAAAARLGGLPPHVLAEMERLEPGASDGIAPMERPAAARETASIFAEKPLDISN